MEKKEELFDLISTYSSMIELKSEEYINVILSNSQNSKVDITNPAISLSYNNIGDNIYLVNLDFTQGYVVGEKVIAEFRMQQSGVFAIQAGDDSVSDFIELALNVSCPDILFPYVRPVHNILISQNGIKPAEIPVFNFYQAYLNEKKNKSLKDKEDNSNLH